MSAARDLQYSVGIAELDAQHRELFKLLDELTVSVEKGDEVDIEYLVAKLDIYSVYHFVTEEYLLEKHGYPELLVQREQHEDFKWRVDTFRQRLHEDKAMLIQEIREFMIDWISYHILHLDMKYSPFLQQRMQLIPALPEGGQSDYDYPGH